MNDKEQFYNEFYSALEKAMEPQGGFLQEMYAPTTNGNIDAILIKFLDAGEAAIIQPDDYYDDWRNGRTINGIIGSINIETVKMAPGFRGIDRSDLTRENASAHLQAAVVNYEGSREWLQGVPFERIVDLAVYMEWRADNPNQNPAESVVITDTILEFLHLAKEEALDIAKINTEKNALFQFAGEAIVQNARERCCPEGIVQEMIQAAEELELHILTNQSGTNGAAAIAGPKVLKHMYETFGEDFYIIPESVNKMVVLPVSKSPDLEEIKAMVYRENHTEPDPENWLSDEVYKFDGQNLMLAD